MRTMFDKPDCSNLIAGVVYVGALIGSATRRITFVPLLGICGGSTPELR
jgi:hypothetical protein